MLIRYNLLNESIHRENISVSFYVDINDNMTGERVSVGPGTLYNLLENFVKADMIRETKVEGRRRSYLITDTGRQVLEAEYQRLMTLTADYQQYVVRKGGVSYESNKA
ncbi:MAG: helix-turn-helix transcriptional regulator [Anaerocolumna sp.]